MISDTINDAVTMQGGAMMLANRYRIVRQLGQGGMGSVWLAEDMQLDGKKFAIKMLPSILVSNKRAYNQLKAEALVAMKLTHPNIVTLRAFEENSGNPFLVMDYIEGQTLDDYLAEKGKLSEEETVKLLKSVAAALDYAHEKGVVHRDVKPGNVMIAKDGTPYVLDFGIAREMQETLTRVTGKLSSGTLLYMSPDQLHGASPKKEQDIYSFAAMAYECLKGEPPFSRGQIEYQIDNDMPEPLGGTRFSASVMAGLAKKPEDRPKSCVAVLEGEGFNRVERAERVEGEGGFSHKERNERKGGGAWKVILSMLVLGLAIGGGMWYYSQQIQEAARKAEQVRKAAEQRAREEAAQRAEAERKAEEDRRAMEKAVQKSEREREAREAQARTADAKQLKKSAVLHKDKQSREILEIMDKQRDRTRPFKNAQYSLSSNRRKSGEPYWEITLILPGGAPMEMIYVAPGSFMMGSPTGEGGRTFDETQHRVTLTKGFWLGKYEVTQRQWESVMGDNPSYFKGADRPVEQVSWEDCQQFIQKVNAQLHCGARLPTEAEWEYVCRAGSAGPFAGTGDLDTMGWYAVNSGETTHEVGQKKPNEWGFYDMHGNVDEWCQDWMNDYPTGNVTDPIGQTLQSRRVTRGGCWYCGVSPCRSAFRGALDPDYRRSDICYGNIGFRLCCSAE